MPQLLHVGHRQRFTLFLAAACALLLTSTQRAFADTDIKTGAVGRSGCVVMTSDTDKALKRGDFHAAIAGYSKALIWSEETCGATLADPGTNRIALLNDHWGRAKAYVGLGEYARAGYDLYQCLRYAYSYDLKAGDLTWAMEVLNKAIRRKPRDAMLRRARAQAYEKQEKPQLALADINAAINLANTKQMRGAAYVDRYWNYKDPRRNDLAFKDLSKAIEIAPRPEPDWFAEHARHLQAIGQLRGAIDDYTKELRLLSRDVDKYENAEVRVIRAELYRQNHQFDDAYRELSKLIDGGIPQDSYVGKKALRARVLVLLEQGRNDQAEADRAKLKKFGDFEAKSAAFACKMAEARNRHRSASGHASFNRKELRTAWKLGEIVVFIPLQHLIVGPNKKGETLWSTISNLMREGQKKAGMAVRGLDPLPTFTGNKSVRLRRTIAFIFRQKAVVESVLSKQGGDAVSAVFSVSAAGNMLYALNRMAVPNVNGQLTDIIKFYAPVSGLPCDVWQKIADVRKRPKAEDVEQAWHNAEKAFDQFVSKS